MEILIRRRVLRCLNWVCTVCHLPFYGSPNYNGLKYCHMSGYIKTVHSAATGYIPGKMIGGEQLLRNGPEHYHIYPKYWDTLSTYHTSKILNSPFYNLLMCLKYCYTYGKLCKPRRMVYTVCKGLSVPILRVITVFWNKEEWILSDKTTLSKLFCLSSGMGSTLKEKNLLLLGANSFLLR